MSLIQQYKFLRKEVEQAYNDKINTDRVRDFNTQTLDLKGANPNIKLYPHQNAGVWRGVQEQAIMLMLVVEKHLWEQQWL